MIPTFLLVTTTVGGIVYRGIKCLRCGRVSYNAHDIAEKYCGHCHLFHEDL